MQQREDTMLSIRSMIQRFRETKPTSRQEREQVRKQRKELPWRVRDESPVGEDEHIQRNSRERDRLLLPDGHQKKIRWAGVEVRRVAEDNWAGMNTANCNLAVDKLMSEDIQRFITTGADRMDRASKPPRVFPSPSLAPISHKPSHAPMETYPRRSLVFHPDRARAALRGSKAARGEDSCFELNLRESLALDPKFYTGSAELRGGTSPTSAQPVIPDDLDRGGQQLNLVPTEDATGVTVSSAADVASDLDGVLKQLRNGMVHEQNIESPGQLTPRANLPVNLTQIAHDLDAKLLEFTLMAKAREQIADEANTAEEVEKDAWRQGETKRVEDMVRQEHAMLQDAANGRESTSPAAKEISEQIRHMLPRFPGHVKSRGYDSDRDSQALRSLSTRHPALPPSALGGHTFHVLEHADAPVEAVTHQMAGVLRAVEAKVQRIEALEVEGSRGEEEEDATTSSDVFIASAKSPPGALASPPCSIEDKHQTADDMDADCTKDVSMYGNDKPLVSARDPSELAAELDGTLTTEGVMELGPVPQYAPHTAYDGLSGRLLIPSEAQISPNVVPQSWLNGQTTLQQAGQCIGAELEVAMLCMQKRLGKQPIEQGAATEGGNEEGPADIVLSEHTEEPHKKVVDAKDVGDPLEASLQENLQVLADGMVTRRERKTHDEVDRALGLIFRDEPDYRWGDYGSATNRLPDGGRVQRDVAKPTPEIRMEVEGPPSSSYLYPPKHDMWAVPVDESLPPNTGLLSEKEIVGASPFNTRPALAPSGGPIFRPAPATVPQPQSKAIQSRLPAGAATFLENPARVHGLGALEGKFQHLSVEGHLQRHDGDGGGFAVARARQRLRSFRTARESVSTDVNVMHRHENFLPRQLSVDQQVVPPSQDESKVMLGRLKEMRYSLHAT